MPRDGKESDLRRVLYGMAADVRLIKTEGGRDGLLSMLCSFSALPWLLQRNDPRRSSSRVRGKSRKFRTELGS
jgi:hypothetical protein